MSEYAHIKVWIHFKKRPFSRYNSGNRDRHSLIFCSLFLSIYISLFSKLWKLFFRMKIYGGWYLVNGLAFFTGTLKVRLLIFLVFLSARLGLSICQFFKNEFWPPRSNLTLKVNLKSLNGYCSETILDIFINFFSAISFDKLHFIIKDFWHVKPKCIFYIVLIHKSFLTSLAIISNFFQISVPLLWMIVVQVKIISIMPICTRWNCNGLSFWNLYSQHIICHCRIDI